MSKSLLFGYVLCIATLVAMLLLMRGAVPRLDGYATFFCISLTGLLMFLAAGLCFRGARSSTGRIRKTLAYCVSAFSVFTGLGSTAAVLLVALGAAQVG